MRGDPRLVALQRLLIELRRAEVPVHGGKIAEAEPFRPEVEVVRAVLDHASTVPLKARAERTRGNPSNLS